jgi:hypothetical protein
MHTYISTVRDKFNFLTLPGQHWKRCKDLLVFINFFMTIPASNSVSPSLIFINHTLPWIFRHNSGIKLEVVI